MAQKENKRKMCVFEKNKNKNKNKNKTKIKIKIKIKKKKSVTGIANVQSKILKRAQDKTKAIDDNENIQMINELNLAKQRAEALLKYLDFHSQKLFGNMIEITKKKKLGRTKTETIQLSGFVCVCDLCFFLSF